MSTVHVTSSDGTAFLRSPLCGTASQNHTSGRLVNVAWSTCALYDYVIKQARSSISDKDG